MSDTSETYGKNEILNSQEGKNKINYQRIQQAVDITLMKNSKIIGIGAGGAYCLYEMLSRSGLGRLSVCDFDTVDNTNLARQGYAQDDIGKLKVDRVKQHIYTINPDTRVETIPKSILELSAQEQDDLITDASLLLFLTDSFPAQAFGNNLAIKYNKPAIWAGFYEGSQCAEIVFTIPGVTPACFRCAVSSRYEAQQHGEIKASSFNNTIFHSHFLDSLIGMLSMAILHNKTQGYYYSNWFGEYFHKNLIQVKLHPDYGTEQGSLFDRVSKSMGKYAMNFQAVWQTLEPERPPHYNYYCPDCGGKAHFDPDYQQ